MKDVSLKTSRYEEMKKAGVNITDKGTSFVELFEKRLVISASVQVSVIIDIETNTREISYGPFVVVKPVRLAKSEVYING